MTKRITIRDGIVRIGRVKDGQPICYSEHQLDQMSQVSVMRLALELTLARRERQRDARGRWMPSVCVWESTHELVARMMAVERARERARAQQRRTKELLHAAARKATYQPRRQRPS
jgi:hypothetical protein